jgi:5'-nucleotidase
MLFFVTNDDGIDSLGLSALEKIFREHGDVIVIAPCRDNSAVSHSLTMNRPLKVAQISEKKYTVDGTPSDCVAIGLGKIVTKKPDLLISGINAGPNLGDDISYSGTVSAAVEGTMYSIPSMAISLVDKEEGSYAQAAEVAWYLAKRILDKGLPENTLMNVNVPICGDDFTIKVTRQGRRLWENSIQETHDPWGETHYWIGGGTPLMDSGNDTDVQAIEEGFVSVTPIHLDLTNHEGVFHLKDDWKLENENHCFRLSGFPDSANANKSRK